MKRCEQLVIRTGLLVSLSLLLAACGEDVVNNTSQGASSTVAALNKAGKCTEERTGETVYAEKDGMLYACDGEAWNALKGDDGAPGKTGAKGDDGDGGDAGAKGAPGSTCTVQEKGDIAQLICGKDTVAIKTESERAGTFTDARDKQVYPWVKIGPFVWMAKNLNYGTMVPKGESGYANQVFTSMNQVKKWCWQDSLAQCDTLGGLYQWANAMALSDSARTLNYSDSIKKYDTIPGYGGIIRRRGICPEGWHIPVDWESYTLLAYAQNAAGGNDDSTGFSLAATGKWFHGEGKDRFGFAALPAVWLIPADGTNQKAGRDVISFLTADYSGSDNFQVYEGELQGSSWSVFDDYPSKDFGYAVRCVKDWIFSNGIMR